MYYRDKVKLTQQLKVNKIIVLLTFYCKIIQNKCL